MKSIKFALNPGIRICGMKMNIELVADSFFWIWGWISQLIFGLWMNLLILMNFTVDILRWISGDCNSIFTWKM